MDQEPPILSELLNLLTHASQKNENDTAREVTLTTSEFV